MPPPSWVRPPLTRALPDVESHLPSDLARAHEVHAISSEHSLAALAGRTRRFPVDAQKLRQVLEKTMLDGEVRAPICDHLDFDERAESVHDRYYLLVLLVCV